MTLAELTSTVAIVAAIGLLGVWLLARLQQQTKVVATQAMTGALIGITLLVLVALGIAGGVLWFVTRGAERAWSAAEVVSLMTQIGLLVLLGFWLLVFLMRHAQEDARWVIAKMAMSGGLLFLAIRAGGDFTRGEAGIATFMRIMFCAGGMAALWVRTLAHLIASPFASLYFGHEEAEAKPVYSQAQAQRMRGHFAEAAELTRAELEKFPGDFAGQMLLAGLQAENLGDLPGAIATIEAILEQSGHPPNSVAYALTTLADWQVQFAQDPDAARAALERIRQLFPDTSLALTASQRIAHLVPREELIARQDKGAFVMPEFEQDIGLRGLKSTVKPREEAPAEMAARFLRRLEQHPQDWEAREQLARLYAAHYGRMDLAVDQLEQLLATPHQPQRLVVQWLTLMSDLQLEHGRDRAAACAALQRIVDLFPGSAFATRAHMAIHQMPAAAEPPAAPEKETGQGDALGPYERFQRSQKNG